MKELHAAYHSKRFIQRRRRFYTENDGLISSKINAVSLTEGNKVLLGTERGLMLFDGSAFSQTAQDRLNGRISFTQRITNKTAVGCGNTVYLIDSDGIAGEKNFESKVISVRDQGDHLWILTETELIRTDLRLENISFCRELEGGLGLSLAVNEDNVYVATEDNILVVHGKRMEWKNIQPGFSDMPSDKIHCIAFDRCGYLWVGTENGPAIYDNCVTWLTADKMTLLPKNPVYKIAEDKAGGKYFATDIGVAYLKDAALKYFSAARWVPDNKINDIAVSDDGNLIYVATDKGLSVITAEHTTLAEKAEYFEEMMEKYFIRRGFTATRTFSDNLDNGTVDISDNDGLWTACYVAAESFRYGATGDEDALRKARRGMNALLFLTQITGIPGFTARAVRYPGEEGYGDGDTEWTLSPDGSCEWKGETSSDEMTGHFFGFSVYFDLCADDTEKEKIRNALCAIGDHIIANNYRLVDKDGLPTTWACWNPQLLNYTDKWFAEKGINSLELLAFLKVCYHVSGDEKYNTLRKEFIREHHYPLNVMQHKVKDAHLCHIDDNLGFLASLTVLRLEENEDLKAFILCGMEDHWRYERVERQPLFCVVHAVFTGRDDDIGEGMRSLREIPLDLTHYLMENSKRRDLVFDTEQLELHEPAQIKEPLPYDERNLHRPDGSSFELDSPVRYSSEEPTIFLLPYWIAKYYGLIED